MVDIVWKPYPIVSLSLSLSLLHSTVTDRDRAQRGNSASHCQEVPQTGARPRSGSSFRRQHSRKDPSTETRIHRRSRAETPLPRSVQLLASTSDWTHLRSWVRCLMLRYGSRSKDGNLQQPRLHGSHCSVQSKQGMSGQSLAAGVQTSTTAAANAAAEANAGTGCHNECN